MQSQGGISELPLQERIKNFVERTWEKLTDRQKRYAKKAWGILTYKWRWQIAMNIPYLAIFLLDRTVPAVHDFDMNLLHFMVDRLPIPAIVSSWMA